MTSTHRDYRAVRFVEAGKVVLESVDGPGPLPPDAIRGPTICSLISAGTEINFNFDPAGKYPRGSGYAAVFRVEEIGSEVEGVEPGELRFASGGHRSWQETNLANSRRLPDGLDPTRGALARLMGVSMSTLVSTKARPGDVVLVSGLGPVGHLAAQAFAVSGYRVFAADPSGLRVSQARVAGIAAGNAWNALDLPEKATLCVECSGHERGVLDVVPHLHRCAEVVLVGVPWKRNTDDSAFAVLEAVFHNYLYLRSGWEWELPGQGDAFRPHCIWKNYETALRWLGEGRIELPTGHIETVDPEDCGEVYQSIADRRREALFTEFGWTSQADRKKQ